MEMLQINIQTKNRLVNQYINQNGTSFFHYSYNNDDDIFKRYNELMGRVFPRKQLTEHIRGFMKNFSLSAEVEQSLAKLADETSVAVIGGQQAGLLTGPLYSIHKVLSIIILAKQMEKKLKKPVVPVFWIAGEDHDILEVNHVYKLEKDYLCKTTFHQKLSTDKKMVSQIQLDKEKLEKWYEEIVASYGETNYSKEILGFLNEKLKESKTYTEFFANIINSLFKKYGLLLIDSAHPDLRKIESSYFQMLIEYSEQLTEKLTEQQGKLAVQGYAKAIDSKEFGCQLFYEHHGERILLEYNKESNRIVGKNVSFSKSELIEIAKKAPERLSNNVVTRPIMQELLFPTIGFIGGPGEISYWAELTGCFELVGLKIPPIFPRLNITFLERNIESAIKELGLSIDNILLSGTTSEKNAKVESLKDRDIEELIVEAQAEIHKQYKKVADSISEYDKGLEKIVEKNSRFVLEQLLFLRRKVDDTVKQKHEILLKKYDRVEESLHPFGGFQERCWNPFYFFNHYGLDLFDRVIEFPFQCNGNHYIIKL